MYRTLVLKFSDDESFEQALDQVMNSANNDLYQRYTRHLGIYCLGPAENGFEAREVLGLQPFRHNDLTYDELPGESVLWAHKLRFFSWSNRLVKLIGQLECLTELHYAIANDFPEFVLEVLNERHPQCKLCIHTFRFWNSHKLESDSYEVKLLQSPCLYSIQYVPDSNPWGLQYEAACNSSNVNRS